MTSCASRATSFVLANSVNYLLDLWDFDPVICFGIVERFFTEILKDSTPGPSTDEQVTCPDHDAGNESISCHSVQYPLEGG